MRAFGVAGAVAKFGRGRRANPAATMSLVEHLGELRRRLAVALLAVGIATGFGFWWYSHTVVGVPSLGALLTGPYCSLPATARVQLGPAGDCRRRIQAVEAFASTSSVNNSEGFFQLCILRGRSLMSQATIAR